MVLKDLSQCSLPHNNMSKSYSSIVSSYHSHETKAGGNITRVLFVRLEMTKKIQYISMVRPDSVNRCFEHSFSFFF